MPSGIWYLVSKMELLFWIKNLHKNNDKNYGYRKAKKCF